MKCTFKPNVEKLEDRLVMDAAGTHAIYQDLVIPTNPEASAVVFVGGWGSSSYQYAYAGTHANSVSGGAGRDVLLGGAGRDNEAAISHGVSVLAWARVDGVSPRALDAAVQELASPTPATTATPLLHKALVSNQQVIDTHADDVWVDGKVITGENFDSSNAPSQGRHDTLKVEEIHFSFDKIA